MENTVIPTINLRHKNERGFVAILRIASVLRSASGGEKCLFVYGMVPFYKRFHLIHLKDLYFSRTLNAHFVF